MSYVFRRPFPSGLESLCESFALLTRPNFAFADLQGVLDASQLPKWASLLLATKGVFELLATASLVICCMLARVSVSLCARARGRTLCATDLADRLNQSMESCRRLPRACNQTHISHISGSNHMQRLVHAGRPKQARYGPLVLQESPQLLKAWSSICSLPCKDSKSVNQPSIIHYGRCRHSLPASFTGMY